MADEVAIREVEGWVQKRRNDLGSRTLTMLQEVMLEVTMDDSGSTAAFDIMEQVLAGGDMDAVFAAANAGTTSGKDYVDKPHYLRKEDIQWKLSTVGMKAEGFPFYILAKVTDMETGERLVINCGGLTYCGTIYALSKIGAFDQFGSEGMPMVIKAKGVDEVKSVLIPQKYVIPGAAKAPKVVKGETVK